MNSSPETIPIQRYIGIDIHKYYLMVGGKTQPGMGPETRQVQMAHFKSGLKRTSKKVTRWLLRHRKRVDSRSSILLM